MPSHRSTKAKRASATNPAELHPPKTIARGDDPRTEPGVVAPITRLDEAAGRPTQRQAVEQAVARQNIEAARSPGAVGPIGRTVLLIALFALVGLVTVWLLLAL